MNYHKSLLFLFCVSLMIVWPTAAQDDSADCPGIVQDAVDAVSDLCRDTGRNQVCYGNLTLVAEPQPEVTDLEFDSPGDIDDVVKIRSLTLSAMDEAVPEWGVTLMRLQADLPDTLPGQNVTVLLFGNAEITSAVDATGDDQPPLQAFYFRSSVGDNVCTEAPASGMVIQTPETTGTVSLTVNQVDISLGSTAYIQAQPDDFLYFYLLDGEATVTAFGQEKALGPGELVTVPINAQLEPTGIPNDPAAFDSRDLVGLYGVVDALPDFEESALVVDAPDQSDCIITTSGTVRLRLGPGTVYERVAALVANENAYADGQATGPDGYTWWHITDHDAWAREDVVSETGECQDLPFITDLPPLPTPVQTGYMQIFWPDSSCNPTSGPTHVYFTAGVGGFETEAEAQVGTGYISFSVVIDGEPGPVSHVSSCCSYGSVHQWQFGLSTQAVEVSPGPHEIAVTYHDPRSPMTVVCTYTAWE